MNRKTKARMSAVGGVLLAALAARVFLAHGLPTTDDEVEHLRVAREISLRPAEFNLPMDDPISSHAMGVVYLTALANWLVLLAKLSFLFQPCRR